MYNLVGPVRPRNVRGPKTLLGCPIIQLDVPIMQLDETDYKTRNDFLPIIPLGAQLHNGQDVVIGLD